MGTLWFLCVTGTKLCLSVKKRICQKIVSGFQTIATLYGWRYINIHLIYLFVLFEICLAGSNIHYMVYLND